MLFMIKMRKKRFNNFFSVQAFYYQEKNCFKLKNFKYSFFSRTESFFTHNSKLRD